MQEKKKIFTKLGELFIIVWSLFCHSDCWKWKMENKHKTLVQFLKKKRKEKDGYDKQLSDFFYNKY